MNFSFNNKRIVVTGAGGGMGRQMARELVKCQANVIAVDKSLTDLESLKSEFPNSMEIIQVDLSNWSETKQKLGHLKDIDGLINNAGISINESLLDIQEKTFDLTFSINVKAIINVSQIIVADMIKRKSGGAIVNISSQASKAALVDHVVYSGSKGAVDSITRTMALELGPHQIRVNCVNPTVVMTDLGRKIWGSNPKRSKDMLDKIPLGRFAEIEDVVNTVLFLLSDKASMINGVQLPVDGGFLAC